MKVGVLGSGDVAKVLATGFLKHGHDVMLGTRSAAKLSDWQTQNPTGRVGSFDDAAKFADLVVLAVKGTAAAEALRAAGGANLIGSQTLDLPFLKNNFTGVGCKYASQHVEDGRLAGAVRADQADDAAFQHLEGSFVHRAQAAERLGERFRFEHHSFSRFASAGQMPFGRNMMTTSSTTP